MIGIQLSDTAVWIASSNSPVFVHRSFCRGGRDVRGLAEKVRCERRGKDLLRGRLPG